MKKLLVIFILPLLLSGCIFPKRPGAVIEPIKVVNIDPKLLQVCRPLVPLTADNPQYIDILNNLEQNANIHYECMQLQENSVRIIKKFANIKD